MTTGQNGTTKMGQVGAVDQLEVGNNRCLRLSNQPT